MDLDKIESTQASLSASATRAISSMSTETLRDAWNTSFSRASPSHKLTLLYFANEVCQRCRKNKPEYLSNSRGFGSILPNAFRVLGEQQPNYRDKLYRIVQVWAERGVFASTEIDAFKRSISGERVSLEEEAESSSSTAKRMKPMSPMSSPPGSSPFDLMSGDMSSLARATSSASLMGETDFDLMRASTPGSSTNELDWMLEVVSLAKDLPVPEHLKDLFRLMSESDRDSVKLELDQENQARLTLRVYKLLKQIGEEVLPKPLYEFCLKEMRESRLARELDDDETRMREDAKMNPTFYDLVETDEVIKIELKPAKDQVQSRKKELEVDMERNEQIVFGLAELLQDMTPVFSGILSKEESQQHEREAEAEAMTKLIMECEQVMKDIQERIAQKEKEKQQEQWAASQPVVPPQAAQIPPMYQQPPNQQRPRKQRWGEPTIPPPPVPLVALPSPFLPAPPPRGQVYPPQPTASSSNGRTSRPSHWGGH